MGNKTSNTTSCNSECEQGDEHGFRTAEASKRCPVEQNDSRTEQKWNKRKQEYPCQKFVHQIYRPHKKYETISGCEYSPSYLSHETHYEG